MTSNQELRAMRDSAVPRGIGTMHPGIFAARANGAEIWDVEGRRYIDLAAGIAVVNTGHNHPRVIEAVRAQLENFSHPCFQVTPYENYVRLADRLNRLAPGNTPKKTVFLTTGAEAVENAVKIARAHTGRPGVIAFGGGFHGRTMMALALTGKVAPYKAGFGPFPGDVYHVPFPIPYHGISEQDSLQALGQLFRTDIEPGRVAAIIIEPVQGEGGFYPASNSFLQSLRKICDEHGIVMIADEIQTGFARTGKLFAIEHAGVEPDIITVAKALAGGFPLSGVIGKAEIMDAPPTGGLGGTYGGSPVGCAAAHAVLDVIEQDDLVARAARIGERFTSWVEGIRAANPCIGDVRVKGAMIAMEFVRNGDADQPDPELTKALVTAGAEAGLILLSCGVRGNVVRLLPPLVISDALFDEALGQLETALARVAENLPKAS
ncbi:MAG: 4-aminobutyrate--2-oxoglutarate transaminase [Gammaproteobacteria bacterium]|nr:4-aminobutyrate--2-oxoglutarate transaminase [Gammaproteobacteria bacterium]